LITGLKTKPLPSVLCIMEQNASRTNRRTGTKSNISDLALSMGKLPPQNLEAEEAVLGALMIEKASISLVQDILRPESFYKEAHRIIYDTILSLDSKGDPIDLLTVTNELRKNVQLEFVGGPYYLVELTQRVSSSANLEYHARIVSENFIKRELIKISSEITRDSFDYTTDVFDLLDHAQQQIFQIVDSNLKKKYASVRDILKEAIRELESKRDNDGGLTGIPTGFSDLDRMTSGFQKSDLIIIAARPGMGKTAFMVSAMRNAAVQFGKPVAMFSLEMSSVQLINRLISAEAELMSDKITKGKLEPFEWQRLHERISNLSSAPIFIDDTPALSIMELRAKSRQLKSQYDIQMIIIDYMQLMRGSDPGKGGTNREQEIATISRGLKGLAKELNIPVIALSQLSRATETRGGDKRPMLSDLRESGSIEQDADMVMFLYRPEYYGILEDEEKNSTKGIGEVIIAKHRNGSLDTIKLRFIGQFTKFADLENDFGSNDGMSSFNSFPSSSSDGPEFMRLPSKLNDNFNKSDDFDLGKNFPTDDEAPF
jgi:replicative DNA helicase